MFEPTRVEAREWKPRQVVDSDPADIDRLQAETGLSALTLRVCRMRGLKTSREIQEFLNPKFESLTHPLSIRDMDRAVARLAQARAQGEKVRIFGDYDVDGTTGAALLSWVFRDFGLVFDARQPDRFKDGYGLNVRAVEEAVEAGARVLLTVDCGITSFDAAEKAKELGIDLIVVDHHQLDPKRGLPAAWAVVNPQRSDCESGLKQLCGCGLAFYLALALRIRGRADGWFATGAEPNLRQHLDLVVMATAADMVPLTGDNHILVRHGLEVLRHSKKPGVNALLQAAGVASRELSPGHLGFVIGPRINASGRMQSADIALELLTTTDELRAASLAREIEQLNQERMTVQNKIWDEVRERIEKGMKEGRFRHGIVVADASWHEGVVGIVASRVTETFRRPAAVIALREDFGKGSVRSYGGKDVLAALRASSETLLGFGGHKFAAGLSVPLDRVDELAESFDRALSEIAEDAEAKPLFTEGECSVDDLDIETLIELERMGPFGPGNAEPVFTLSASVKNFRVLKERHLKLNLSNASGAEIEAIWFNAAERAELLEEDELKRVAEWAGVPELNRFRGKITPTFRVRDRRVAELSRQLDQ
ncbi:MAG: single-stranded-DNA-specific exonuclease RecJ [Oligoflexia bacterium]|nr:single-stranded-DNA-specific exonuclease RecJ [Oligoflexia bacterium]